jgi:hypothetical protein
MCDIDDSFDSLEFSSRVAAAPAKAGAKSAAESTRCHGIGDNP